MESYDPRVKNGGYDSILLFGLRLLCMRDIDNAVATTTAKCLVSRFIGKLRSIVNTQDSFYTLTGCDVTSFKMTRDDVMRHMSP